MNSFSDNKETGIDWIGKIPSEWSLKPLFSVASENKYKNSENSETVLSLSYGKIKLRDLSKNKGILPDNFDNYQVVKDGYIIIRSTDLQNDKKSLRVGLVTQEGVITSAYLGLIPYESLNSNYFYHYLHACDIQKVFYGLGGGVRQSLGFEDFKRYPVPLPSLEEQSQIVKFLDKKLSQIDLLIEKTERKIELLKEQQTATINHYVTKGLDPSVKMKDSGIEWIGEIPEHWTTSKLKYLSSSGVQYGLNIESESYQDSGVRFMRITDINQDGTIKNEGVYLNSIDVPDEYYLTDGDILFSRSGGTVGKSCLIFGITEPMSFAGYLVRFSFKNKDLSNFVKWITESRFYWDWINLQIIQSTIQNVNGEKYSNFSFPLPPSSEMNEISKLLDQIYKKLDQSITLNNKRIELLKEYRQSLISNVVTGKVRVTEEVI